MKPAIRLKQCNEPPEGWTVIEHGPPVCCSTLLCIVDLFNDMIHTLDDDGPTQPVTKERIEQCRDRLGAALTRGVEIPPMIAVDPTGEYFTRL